MAMTATASLTREAIDQIIEDHFRREADGDVEGTLALSGVSPSGRRRP
jgi:hypothetical protein